MGLGSSSFGLVGSDFVIVAIDRTLSTLVVMKDNEEKIKKISDHIVMAITGSPGDTTQFSEFIAKNIHLYQVKHGYGLSLSAVANFTRRTIAESLRSRAPYSVSLLLCGYDEEEGPQLYFMDRLGCMQKMPFAAQGCGGKYTMSILDRYRTPFMTREHAYEVMKLCVREVHKRCIFNLESFSVHLVDKHGVVELPPITTTSLVLDVNHCVN